MGERDVRSAVLGSQLKGGRHGDTHGRGRQLELVRWIVFRDRQVGIADLGAHLSSLPNHRADLERPFRLKFGRVHLRAPLGHVRVIGDGRKDRRDIGCRDDFALHRVKQWHCGDRSRRQGGVDRRGRAGSRDANRYLWWGLFLRAGVVLVALTLFGLRCLYQQHRNCQRRALGSAWSVYGGCDVTARRHRRRRD